jgi:serine/threonine protein kinase
MRLQVGDVFDEFEVIKYIGAGAFAEVYLAYDTILDRKVVLKQLSPELSTDDSEWSAFVNEAQVTASFFHPGIITVHALRINAKAGSAVLVLEYMDGGTLRDLIKHGALDLELIWKLAYHIGDALSYLHTRGVVHRDIKPENILYSREMGWFKLTDFGLAYHPDRAEFEALNHGQPGTLMYMSPEQTLNHTPVTERFDLYSFGVVLYEALTGKYYLEVDPVNDPPQEIARHIQYTPPRPLNLPANNTALLEKLTNVLFRSLAKHPLRRYPTVRRFVRAFTRVIEDIELDQNVY